MERTNAPMTFLDSQVADLGGPRTKSLLNRLDEAIPWNQLAAPIRELPEYQPSSKGGNAAWPAVTMLKCLLLAKWFGLSDPQLEECLRDRLSFRQFIGLSLSDRTPDETTFVKFRKRLREAKLDRVLFDNALAHLETQGLLVHDGTLVDATIIEQSNGRRRDDGTSTRDPDASYTKKHGRTYHGYKGHVAVDRSRIVIDYRLSTARHHDSRYIDELTACEHKAVIADSAYDDQHRRAALRQRGVIDGIVYKRKRGQDDLSDWQVRWNTIVSSLRAGVEHPFAVIKNCFGWRRCRYRGERRNEFDLAFNLLAHNLKHALSLATASREPPPA